MQTREAGTAKTQSGERIMKLICERLTDQAERKEIRIVKETQAAPYALVPVSSKVLLNFSL